MDRYHRQKLVNGFGELGQTNLKNSKILVIGAGGLGAACLPYIVGAGVGVVAIMDTDVVDISNLHRQVLYDENDVGQLKAKVAAKKLRALNSLVSIEVIIAAIDAKNASHMIADYDIIVDCTDSFNAKYAICDACDAANKPMVSASIEGVSGYFGIFCGENLPSYRALFNEPALNALNCAQSGVVGTVAGMFGLMQAHGVIKLLTDIGEVDNRVALVDFYDFSVRKVALPDQYDSRFLPFALISEADCKAHLLIDVREESEFLAGHFSNAINIPLSYIMNDAAEVMSAYAMDEKIALYCSKGVRAERAGICMQRAGFTKISLLDVGYH